MNSLNFSTLAGGRKYPSPVLGVFLLATHCSIVSCFWVSAFAEEPTPRICVGYNPIKQNFDPIRVNSPEGENCPQGYSFFSQEFPVGPERPGRKISVHGPCCPLPEGVLTEEHVWELEECPPGYIATGGRSQRAVRARDENDFARAGREMAEVDQYFRCTKINTNRFQLSAPVETLTIGFNEGFTWNTLMRKFTSISRIPVALRYGVARRGRLTFDGGGCMGFPWGSLLTRKIHKLCGFEFRELQYTGADGDPPQGTPVRLYPDCLSIDDPLSPDPQCVRNAVGETENSRRQQ